MMRFVFSSEEKPLSGRCIYRAYEYSFDFEPDNREEVIQRAGEKGTTSLVIGTLQIEVGILSAALLYAWGYHPHTSWRRDHLPPISWEKGCVKVQFDQEPIIGVSQGLAEVGEWQTTYDANTGWICVSSHRDDAGERYVEFAEDTIAGLANEKLVSLWLRPGWRQERFEEGSTSLFSELKT